MNQFHYVGTRHPEKKPGRTARGRLAVLRALDSSMVSGARWRALTPAATLLIYWRGTAEYVPANLHD